jgi:hypothetical protein
MIHYTTSALYTGNNTSTIYCSETFESGNFALQKIDGSTKDDISTTNTLDVPQKNERNKKT